VSRPRLLLVPEVTEIQWTIRPLLEEWADVRSYDPPGVGDEPPPAEWSRQAIVARGLEELDQAGWDRFFLVADGWGVAVAARIAEQRPASVLGLALGHACISFTRKGERASVDGAIVAAMSQLIANDAPAFVLHGIVQATQGSVDEALAEKILARAPREHMAEAWAAANADEDFAEALEQLGCPMLLAQHEGCLVMTDEGFEDAVAAFPQAETLRVPDPPCVSPAFAGAVRAFCTQAVVRR
jgi:pimeloyl-ACP methyl ester carboxylesterase